ncbi:MAG: thioredoxin-related protein [Porticoccaceae bacterium]|jgi:thioredoxin-related protein
MKNKLALILFFFMLTVPSGFAQLKAYSFEEAEKLSVENPKPIVVFIHTSWCKYCTMMKNITFKNPAVISLLNEHFYFILLDAENRNDVAFNNHTFKFKPTGPKTGLHELATALSIVDNQLTYPTITIIDRNYSIIFQRQSYLKTKDLISILEKIN